MPFQATICRNPLRSNAHSYGPKARLDAIGSGTPNRKEPHAPIDCHCSDGAGAGSAAVSFAQDAASEAPSGAMVSGATDSFKRMPDGKEWTTDNLKVNAGQSYCYDDTELNCHRYGSLYSWEAAQRGCQSLGTG
jgi:hypothetical protein